MKVPQFFLAQWAVLGLALGAADPPPLPSYNFGITGEPTKVDTAFGNLGELGPVYDVPEPRNDSSATSGGKPLLVNTHGSTTRTTEPSKIIQPTSGELNSSNLEELTTVKTTYSEEITLPGTGIALNGTENEKKPMEPSTAPNVTQTFETTTVAKEKPTLITTESGNNTTSNTPPSYTTNMMTTTTKSSEDSSNPSTPSSPPSTQSSNPSSTQRSTLHPSSTQESTLQASKLQTIPGGQPSQTFHTTQTTPGGPPSQTFHTVSPNPIGAPTIPPSPGHNETKPGQNSTTPSKPNSSLLLYPSAANIWLTLAVISFYLINTKYK